MNFTLLLKDELEGFYKSSVMIVLWTGMPVFSILLYLISPEMEEGVSFSFMVTSIISAMGGFVASLILAVHIIHERSKNVYELFLIRPIKRWHILLSKFFSVFLCVAVASGLSLLLGVAIDYVFNSGTSAGYMSETLKAFATGAFIIALECSGAVLIGVLTSSVLIGILLIIVNHNISSMVMIMPTVIKLPQSFLLSILSGSLLIILLIFLSVLIFNRKQF